MKKKQDFKLDEEKFIRQVEEDINLDVQATQTYRSNRKKWIELSQDEPTNIHAETDTSDEREEFKVSLPLIATTIDQLHSRRVGAIYQNKPIIRMAPTDKYDVEKVKASQDFINYRLTNCTPNFHRVYDENDLITLGEGQSFTFQTWVREERKVCHKYQYPAINLIPDPMSGQLNPQPATIEQIITSLFNIEGEKRITPNTEIEEIGEDRYKIQYQMKRGPDDWSDHEAIIDFSLDDNYEDPSRHTIHVKVISTEIVFEGVKIRNVNLDFLYFPKDVLTLQPPDCPHLVIKSEESISEIKHKIEIGEYNLLTPDKLEKVKSHLTSYKDETEDKAISETLDTVETLEGTNRQIFPDDIAVKYICYYSYDVDNDGIKEEIEVTLFPDARVIAKTCFLEEVYKHGKRPIRHLEYDIRPYSILGKGVPENLYSLQELYDDVWNQMLNYGAVIALPFFFYEASGNLQGEVYKLRPGEGYPVSGVDNINFPAFQNNLPITFAELQQIYSHVERRSKVNESLYGRQGQARQTATATLKLLGEAMEGQQINFNRYRQGWAEIFKDFYLLHMAYMPDQMKYRVFDPMANKYEFRTISRRDLMEMPDINFDIHLEHTSDVFQREMWMQLMQTMVNPVTLQMGIVQPAQVANYAERVIQSFKIEDVDNFIVRPEPMEPPMDPMEIAIRLSQGDYVKPNPQENAQQTITLLQTYLIQNRHLITPEYKQLFVQRIVETQMMLQKQQQMMQYAQAAAMMQMTGQGLLGQGGQGGGGFVARPDVGRSPMQALGEGLAAGRQNQPGINTREAMGAPMQG
ncbi:MAG: hypothetical protein ACFE9S_07655 [Candidatus Hermodarchaeota archaeon]